MFKRLLKKSSGRWILPVLLTFLSSVFLVAAFLPLFLKRGIWEEWGWTEDGGSYSKGGLRFYRSSFSDTWSSNYLDGWNVFLNVSLLLFYSLILTALGVLIWKGLKRFFK